MTPGVVPEATPAGLVIAVRPPVLTEVVPLLTAVVPVLLACTTGTDAVVVAPAQQTTPSDTRAGPATLVVGTGIVAACCSHSTGPA